ncbi:MAG TPA: DUF4401 domain-containing protein [Burkholderiales bacterium]|nr:DUF4401 domain-containing protein [Burkholderiales bacterium]
MSAARDTRLWDALSRAGLTHGDMPRPRESQTPWYVRVMLGAAGIVAALFLIGFFALAFQFIVNSPVAAAVIGASLIGAAYAIFRHGPAGDFAPMFALAISIAGQAFFVFGLVDTLQAHSLAGIASVIAALEAGLVVAMPSYLHRVGSSYAAATALAIALRGTGMGVVAPGAIAAAFAWLWLNEARLARRHSLVTPIAYGLTLAFVQMEAAAVLGRGAFFDVSFIAPPPTLLGAGEALVAGVWLATVAALVRRAGWRLTDRPALAAVLAAALLGAASLHAPGFAGGLAIVVLGFAAGNVVLWGLGLAGLLGYIGGYYYSLDLTLLGKAATLAAAGAVLLGARALLLKRVLPDA